MGGTSITRGNHMFSLLKRFMQDENFDSDEEMIHIVEDYLRDRDFDFLSEGI